MTVPQNNNAPKLHYRLEQYKSKNGTINYYITKDINLLGHRTKIRKKVGVKRPTEKELTELTVKYAEEIEAQALEKEKRVRSRYYKTNYLKSQTLEQLEEIRVIHKRYTELLTIDEIRTYESDIEVKYVHGTTSVEGNTLTEQQARDLLTQGKVPSDKTDREIYEVQNFKSVKKFRDSYKGKITLGFIKKIHRLSMQNMKDKCPGVFRQKNVVIGGCEKQVTHPSFIELALQEIIDNYYINIKNRHNPFEEAALFHYKFEIIHPFIDGNGRVGREIFNFMLRKQGYPWMLIVRSNRDSYLQILQLGDEDKIQDMIEHFACLFILQSYVTGFVNALQDLLSKDNKEKQTFSYNTPSQFVINWEPNTLPSTEREKNSFS
ncbi:MAG: Fic family protein [Candidatus Bathyarchaeota archaeon]|nr:Fic family protein [Candidatus Termiticorpusculum sp.]